MMRKVWESEGHGMAATTTPIAKTPVAEEVSIEDFFGKNMDQMDEQQLQEFDRASEEIMKRGRVLGAGKAIHPLPDEAELERIDREWKREIEDKVLG
jgi:hypothetical protein